MYRRGDVAGPFVTIPRAMAAQAKLEAASYESPLEALAEKFHCSPNLLRALNPEQSFRSARADTILAPNVAAAPLAPAASVVVDESDASVTALDTDGKVIARFPASVGSEHTLCRREAGKFGA